MTVYQIVQKYAVNSQLLPFEIRLLKGTRSFFGQNDFSLIDEQKCGKLKAQKMRWQMNIFEVCFRHKFVCQKSTSFWGVLIHSEA